MSWYEEDACSHSVASAKFRGKAVLKNVRACLDVCIDGDEKLYLMDVLYRKYAEFK